jgi:hypothetical protein
MWHCLLGGQKFGLHARAGRVTGSSEHSDVKQLRSGTKEVITDVWQRGGHNALQPACRNHQGHVDRHGQQHAFLGVDTIHNTWPNSMRSLA